MKRRCFLGSAGGGFAGAFAIGSSLASGSKTPGTHEKSESIINEIESPNDVKLNVKPVYSALIHSEKWEGPCRPSPGKSGDEERAAHQKSYKRWVDNFINNKALKTNVLNPECLEYLYAHKDFKKQEKEFLKLEGDKNDVDLYLVSEGTASQALAVDIAKRLKKPVAIMSSGLKSIDASAHLRCRGFEGYAPLDYNELNLLINLLRIRKVFRQTNILLITDVPMPAYSAESSVWDFDDLALRFGIGAKIINFDTLSEEMERVLHNKDEQKKAENLADKLIKNAQGSYLDRKYVIASAHFYHAVKYLMERYNCNAFTIECWEFCTSRLPEKWKITPCLIHTLLKDEGYASACQNDVSALLSMRLLMTLANKSSFMGNQFMDMETNLVKIGHSVPGIKMNGYDKPDLPYDLRNFCESGWGTKVQIDFAANSEKTVTLVRINPLAAKIMAAKGEIEKCVGFNEGSLIGCSLQAHLRLPDPREFMHISADFGAHVAMAYGDYIKELKELGDILDMEVVAVS